MCYILYKTSASGALLEILGDRREVFGGRGRELKRSAKVESVCVTSGGEKGG